MGKILVVDDERSILEFFEIFLTQEGYQVETSEFPEKALERLHLQKFDLLITDLSMPSMDGLKVLENAKKISPETSVIIMTAYATAESAIEAMRNGAYDYLMKPFKVEDIRRTIRNAVENINLKKENKKLREKLEQTDVGLKRFVGKSECIRTVTDLIRRVSQNRASVLLWGESGTGKELAARAIHELSNRADKPFVSINCGAIPENLLESELFGHEKGAFTGADHSRVGLFEAANEGTLFLDEISELPLHMQVKLLRVLQEKCVRKLGSSIDVNVDVRVISATNKELDIECEKGLFREDLFYRLNVIQIRMPPLRERKEDIPLLVQAFLKKSSYEQGKEVKGVSGEAMEKLINYHYPGNIRELENIIEQAVALETKSLISASIFPDKIKGTTPRSYVEVEKSTGIPKAGIDL